MGATIWSIINVQAHTLTRCRQAEEEGGLLRTFKQKDIFRMVLLSGETKGGSDMTSPWRESEGHRWCDGHAYGTVSHIHTHMLVSHNPHIQQTQSRSSVKSSQNSRFLVFADIRIIGMFCVLRSIRNPQCFFMGCF